MTDDVFMRIALQEAQTAFDKDEVPVGAVVVFNNKVIAKAHNMSETLMDVTAHAEMLAFTSAANYIGGKLLKNCTLYVTLEPCIMCYGASYWTQISRIVYGSADDKRNTNIDPKSIVHPKTEIYGGILQNECTALLKDFFIKRR